MSELIKYEGGFVILLEPNADLSMLSSPAAHGSLEIEKKEQEIIVTVVYGLVEEHLGCVHFCATREGDLWHDPFVWPDKYLKEVRTSRRNVLWKKSFKKG